MRITLEFISAYPQALVDVFLLKDDEEFLNARRRYPVADFSLHLQLPEDMDRLCQSMKQQALLAPPHFREVLVEQLWDDVTSAESLTLVAEGFAVAWASVDDNQLEHVAQDWASEFHYQSPLSQTPAYQALVELRNVARDVVTQKTSLILHLAGSPLF